MKILLTIGCLSIFTITTSQSIGIKTGSTLSNLHMNIGDQLNIPANNFLLGFNIGVYSILPLKNKLKLVTEIQFIQRGFKNDYQPNKVRLNYLELPILLSYSLIKNFNIEFGPSFGLKLSDNLNAPDGFYSHYDYGLNFGGRIQPINKLEIIARFYYGTHAIIKFDARDNSNNPIGVFKARNLGYQLGIGYLLFKRS